MCVHFEVHPSRSVEPEWAWSVLHTPASHHCTHCFDTLLRKEKDSQGTCDTEKSEPWVWMKEEIWIGLLCHSAGPEWGALPQVRPFSTLAFFLTLLLWVLKCQCSEFAKLLEPPLSQKGQRGESLWERGVSSPYPPTPCLVPERVITGECVCWLCVIICLVALHCL